MLIWKMMSLSFDADSDEVCRAENMHANSSTMQLNADMHVLAERRRHWRRRCPGLEVAGELIERLHQNALISTHRGPRPLSVLHAVTRKTTSRAQSTGRAPRL